MCKEKTYDGTPYEVKVSRTVWSGGKGSDNIKTLPITIYEGLKEGERIMEKIRNLNLELVDMDEVVNHPKHYTTGNIEVIDYIEDQNLGYCLGNAVKYISRAGKKDPSKEIEDLYKAAWYVNRRIKELEIQKMEEESRKDGVNPLPGDVLR